MPKQHVNTHLARAAGNHAGRWVRQRYPQVSERLHAGYARPAGRVEVVPARVGVGGWRTRDERGWIATKPAIRTHQRQLNVRVAGRLSPCLLCVVLMTCIMLGAWGSHATAQEDPLSRDELVDLEQGGICAAGFTRNKFTERLTAWLSCTMHGLRRPAIDTGRSLEIHCDTDRRNLRVLAFGQQAIKEHPATLDGWLIPDRAQEVEFSVVVPRAGMVAADNNQVAEIVVLALLEARSMLIRFYQNPTSYGTPALRTEPTPDDRQVAEQFRDWCREVEQQ